MTSARKIVNSSASSVPTTRASAYVSVSARFGDQGAVKLQALHGTQAPAAPVIPLTTATRGKCLISTTVRVGRAAAQATGHGSAE